MNLLNFDDKYFSTLLFFWYKYLHGVSCQWFKDVYLSSYGNGHWTMAIDYPDLDPLDLDPMLNGVKRVSNKSKLNSSRTGSIWV